MLGRNPARYLAPIALAAAVAGTYLIVSDHTGGSSSTHAVIAPRKAAPPRHASSAARKRFYTVQSGDSLSRIAVKTGVPITTLEQLNPSLNPNTLQTGQQIRLRR